MAYHRQNLLSRGSVVGPHFHAYELPGAIYGGKFLELPRDCRLPKKGWLNGAVIWKEVTIIYSPY